MTCIKMGSDGSHFNASLIVRDKVTRQCPQTTTLLKRKQSRSGIEPRSFRRLLAYCLTARPNRLSRVHASGSKTQILPVLHTVNRQTTQRPIVQLTGDQGPARASSITQATLVDQSETRQVSDLGPPPLELTGRPS